VVYDKFCDLCSQKGVSPSKAAMDAGFSKSLISKWKSKQEIVPSSEVLQKIADYFGVSVDYLLGKEKQPTEGELHPANKKLMELSRTLSPEEAEKVYKAISLLLEK
jgi:transcriptional regulator with XRE-family HTH domain